MAPRADEAGEQAAATSNADVPAERPTGEHTALFYLPASARDSGKEQNNAEGCQISASFC